MYLLNFLFCCSVYFTRIVLIEIMARLDVESIVIHLLIKELSI